jgi:hypothetical protein
MDLPRLILFNLPLGSTGQPLHSDPPPGHADRCLPPLCPCRCRCRTPRCSPPRHVVPGHPPCSFSMRLSRPYGPHFPFASVQTPPSAPLASRPHHVFLSDFERVTTSPYPTLPRLAVPVHQRSPAIIGLRRITAALHCSGDSRFRARFPSSPQLWHVAHLPYLLPRLQESSELAASDHAPSPSQTSPCPVEPPPPRCCTAPVSSTFSHLDQREGLAPPVLFPALPVELPPVVVPPREPGAR